MKVHPSITNATARLVANLAVIAVNIAEGIGRMPWCAKAAVAQRLLSTVAAWTVFPQPELAIDRRLGRPWTLTGYEIYQLKSDALEQVGYAVYGIHL